MTSGTDPAAAWDVLVLPVAIEAATEDEARAEFLQALIEDNSLIRVQPHALDIYVEGNDAIYKRTHKQA